MAYKWAIKPYLMIALPIKFVSAFTLYKEYLIKMWYQFCFCCLSGNLSTKNLFLVEPLTLVLESIWLHILMEIIFTPRHTCPLGTGAHPTFPVTVVTIWEACVAAGSQQFCHEHLNWKREWMKAMWELSLCERREADGHCPLFRGGRRPTPLKRQKGKRNLNERNKVTLPGSFVTILAFIKAHSSHSLLMMISYFSALYSCIFKRLCLDLNPGCNFLAVFLIEAY